MTPSEWAENVAHMAALWPHHSFDPATAEAWFPLLAALDAGQVRAAIDAIALEPDNRFPPTVGQLRAAAEGSRTRHWEDALAELARLARQVGAYKPKPDIPDPALEAVVEAWGWQGVCRMNAADPTTRAQFRDTYQAAAERVADEQRRQIAGQAGAGHTPKAVGGGNGGAL